MESDVESLRLMQPIAYFNGEYVPAEEACLSVTDWGFVQGVTLAEQLRTFRGAPFRVQQHVERLLTGLSIVEWEQIPPPQELSAIIEHVASHNYQQLDPLDDLGICLFMTPGPYPSYGQVDRRLPTICTHTYPLSFRLWHEKYEQGSTLITVGTRQVPTDCWPAELKCRSRMHYYLAAHEAHRRLPGATALLLDHDGFVSETPTANVIAYFAEAGLVSPPREKILPGISLDFVAQLARELGLPMEFRDLGPAELARADEVMLTSTPFCLLPVSRLDDRQFSSPGRLYQELLHAWSVEVGVPIVQQADRFAHRK